MTSDPLYQAVRRYVLRLLSDVELAKDIAQEVFLRRQMQLQNQRAVRNERAWAYRTARNLVTDYFRKQGNRGSIIELTDSFPDESTRFRPLQQAETKEQAEILHDKLNDLSARHREAIRLKFQEGLSYVEIGKIMEVPRTTVAWLLRDAIEKLRNELVGSPPPGGCVGDSRQ